LRAAIVALTKCATIVAEAAEVAEAMTPRMDRGQVQAVLTGVAATRIRAAVAAAPHPEKGQAAENLLAVAVARRVTTAIASARSNV